MVVPVLDDAVVVLVRFQLVALAESPAVLLRACGYSYVRGDNFCAAVIVDHLVSEGQRTILARPGEDQRDAVVGIHADLSILAL